MLNQQAPQKTVLKYLFEAEYYDGTTYNQTPEDQSKLDEKKSEFYDVLNSGKVVKRFSLIGEGNKISVDLSTGLFEVNGLPLLLESDKLPTLPDKFELIFYRQWTREQNITYEKRSGNIVNRSEGAAFCEYFIGWQCLIAGKNYQQKMAIA